MLRRLPAPWPLVATLAILAATPAATLAADMPSMQTFRLRNDSGSTITQALADIIPPGSVAPTDPSASPLAILDGSTGFNPDALTVGLGYGQTSSGDPLQVLGLDFGADGLKPGGQLLFGLNLSPTFQGQLTLMPDASSQGLTFEQYTPPGTSTPTDPGGPTTSPEVPEPLSLAVWSTMAGLGLIRARAYRRSRRSAA